MFVTVSRNLAVAVAVGLLVPTLQAADIFEPWEPGFTDVELFLGLGEGGDAQGQALVGFGFGRGGSLGLSISTQEGDAARFGLVVAMTRSLGDDTDLSLWAESGLAGRKLDVELAHTDWTAGFQLVHWRDGAVPYGSLSFVGEEGEDLRLHPLMGLMLPRGPLELHFELSSDQPEGGAWPVHLAIGPNVHLAPWIEILPEISVVRESGGGTHWAATVGVIVDPRHWMGSR